MIKFCLENSLHCVGKVMRGTFCQFLDLARNVEGLSLSQTFELGNWTNWPVMEEDGDCYAIHKTIWREDCPPIQSWDRSCGAKANIKSSFPPIKIGEIHWSAAGGYTWRPNMENEGFKMSQFPNPVKFSSSLSDCFMGYLGDGHHAGLLILSFVLSCCHLNDCFIILSQRTKGNLC